MKTQNFYSLEFTMNGRKIETRYYRFLKQCYDALTRCGAVDVAYCTFTTQFKKEKKNSTFYKTSNLGTEWEYTLKEHKLILKQ